MNATLRVILAQLNFTVGDIIGNTQKIIQVIQKSQQEFHADVIVFPELSLSSYSPEDLLLRHDFLQKIQQSLEKICLHTKGIYAIIGHPHKTSTGLYNAASVLNEGKIITTYHKQLLPNYSVFDEKRYFTAGYTPCVINIKGIKCGITICEDLWHHGPATQALKQGAEFLISLNASPFNSQQAQARLQVLQERNREIQLPILYVNLIGGQDELLFDGGSLALQKNGEIVAQAPYFKETLLPITLKKNSDETIIVSENKISPPLNKTQAIYEALVLGTKDYIQKNNFSGVLLGLSGGIDSALGLAIAYDAIGKENVHAIMMPSRYTSELSLEGAKEEAKALGVNYNVISIEPIYEAFLTNLAPFTKNSPSNSMEENLQARCRGVILMALSNKTKHLVLTTSNKSEMAVGYTTLYGDMAGGLAVLKDVFKTEVYELVAYRNQLSSVIPQRVIQRAPSAELANNQTDQDTLPPYPILDKILKSFIEENLGAKEIISQGIEKETVEKVVQLIQQNEYKRRQGPPCIRITQRAFGKDWRLPITSRFKYL